MSFSRLKLHRHLGLIFTGGECRPSLERGKKILTDLQGITCQIGSTSQRSKHIQKFTPNNPRSVLSTGYLLGTFMRRNTIIKCDEERKPAYLKIIFNPPICMKMKIFCKCYQEAYLDLLFISAGLKSYFFFSSLKDSVNAKMFLLLKKELNH